MRIVKVLPFFLFSLIVHYFILVKSDIEKTAANKEEKHKFKVYRIVGEPESKKKNIYIEKEKKDSCFQGGWVGATKNPPTLIMLGGNYKKI